MTQRTDPYLMWYPRAREVAMLLLGVGLVVYEALQLHPDRFVLGVGVILTGEPRAANILGRIFGGGGSGA